MQGKAGETDELGYVEGKSFFLDCIQEGKPDGLEDAQIHADAAKTIEMVAGNFVNTSSKIFQQNNFGCIWSSWYENYYGGKYFSGNYNHAINLMDAHTFTFILNDGTLYLYLDGEKQENLFGNLSTKTFDIEPQNFAPNTKFKLYSFRVYPQALSQQEIMSNYNTDKKRFDL